MKIKSLEIGIDNNIISNFNFANNTLIFSKENSKGKTTLLRFLLHSLLYNVPSTSKVSLNDFCTILRFENEEGKEFTIMRNNKRAKIIFDEKNKKSYDLNDKESRLNAQSFIFGIGNIEIINNLLGCFYIDQDVGWVVTNKGIISGSNNTFNIIDFIGSIKNKELFNKEKARIKKLDRVISKYTAIKDIATYKRQTSLNNGAIHNTNRSELFIKKAKIESELESENKIFQSIKYSLNSNESFKNMIEDMNLLISYDGKTFPLKIDNICGFPEQNDMLLSKFYASSNRIELLKRDLSEIEEGISNCDDLNVESLSDEFFSKIPNVDDFDQISLDNVIAELKKEKSLISKSLVDKAKNEQEINIKLSNYVREFCIDLEVLHEFERNTKGILHSNENSGWSGAILNKIVLAYRCSYCKLIEDIFGVSLPLILDSPGESEMSDYNIKLIFNLLNKKFKSHQIIISSIYESVKEGFDYKEFIELNSNVLSYNNSLF